MPAPLISDPPTSDLNKPARSRFFLFVTLFFFSGAAGLLYEVLWMRQFGLVMGNTSVSLSAVLTAFMGGLALGSWLGGRLADKSRNHLRLYGALELLIGLYALAVPFLISGIAPIIAPFYRSDPTGWPLHIIRFILALGIMIVPTTLMGATLPLLIRHFTIRKEEVGRRAGMLYGINTIGAMVGAFFAGFFFIPGLGMFLTNATGAALNIGVGLLGLATGARGESSSAGSTPGSSDGRESAGEGMTGEESANSRLSRTVALWGIAISGIAAMIYQVCWTRMFALLLGSSTYAFSLVLVATIGGLALGGLVFGRWIDRSRHPMVFFAVIQLAIGAAALVLAFISGSLPLIVLKLVKADLNQYGVLLASEFVLIGLLLIIPTFLMGGVFPVAARICAGAVSDLGRTIGTVYAINTVGAVIGSFCAGLILMNYLGLRTTILIAVGMNMVVAVAAALSARGASGQIRAAISAIALLITVLLLAYPPQWEKQIMTSGPFRFAYYDSKHGITDASFREKALKSKMVYYRDDMSGTVTVLEDKVPFNEAALTINGKPDASNGLGDIVTMFMTGHLGLILHPDAKKVMHLGLGAGLTLASILQHDSVEQVDVVEISPAVVDAVRRHFGEINLHALDDPRVRVILADGRNHLALTDQKYDLIVSQPSNPWIAGISSLFTVEFFEQCRSRLNPGGMICLWIHLYHMSHEDFMTVVKTVSTVMPEVTLWETNDTDFLLVGSETPVQIGWNRFKEAVEAPKIKKHLDAARLGEVRLFISHYVASKADLSALDSFKRAPLNVDDTCRLEFSAPKAYYETQTLGKYAKIYEMQQSPASLFNPATLTEELRQWMARIPVARRLVQRAGEAAERGEVQAMESNLLHSIELNPWDYAARIHLYQFYYDIAMEGANKNMLEMARAYVLRAVETYEYLGLSYDRWEVSNLYNLQRMIALHFRDETTAQKATEKIMALGGEPLLNILSEGQSIGAAPLKTPAQTGSDR